MSEQKYSQLRNESRRPLAEMLPLSFPLSIYIEVTNKCNLRCTYCPLSLPEYSETVGGFKSLSMEQFEKVSLDIKAGGKIKVLRFYFIGEPLVNTHLPEMISMAKKMDLADRTELTSNVTLLTEEKSKQLVNSGLDYLRVSISGVEQERHEQITQTKIKVSKIYENLKRFREIRDSMGSSKPFLYIKMLDTLSAEENEKFLEMYKDIADEIAIEKPMNWDGYSDHDLIANTYGEDRKKTNPDEVYLHKKQACPFPFYNLTINVNGDATACCVDWNKATKVGNIFESSITEVWNGREMSKLRELHLFNRRSENSSCAKCEFLYTSPDNIDNMSAEKIDRILNPQTANTSPSI
jgi:radical SAM protein with 4Fe4S-binding SPASM domain